MSKKNCIVFVFTQILFSAAQQSQSPPQTNSVNKPAGFIFLARSRGLSAFFLKEMPIDLDELEARAEEIVHAAPSQQRAK